ncbi:hypothetical protein, partial [Christiangramia sp.]|uniref:hypothetical protein n=1 Tax=Christiangramia sp. TaxID=1931228 RepID=UPI00260C949B
ISYQLSVISYQLSVISYQLSEIKIYSVLKKAMSKTSHISLSLRAECNEATQSFVSIPIRLPRCSGLRPH